MSSLLLFWVALCHLLFFFAESIYWGRPRLNRLLRLSAEQAECQRLFAFNQGFYNLFLVLAIAAGFFLRWRGQDTEAALLQDYAAFSVLGAGMVLAASGRRYRAGGLFQAAPAALYLMLRFIF